MHTKTVSFLSDGALERIHVESLKILENVGVRVDNPECRAVLERAGAKAVGQTDVMRLPAQMVEEGMAQITKRFELVHPSGERIVVPDGTVRVGTRVKMPKVLDYGATTCRPPSVQDVVVNLCRITNALPAAVFSCAIQYPSSDVPPGIDVADTLALVFAVTGHLSMCAPGTVEDARVSLDVALAAVGSDDLERDLGIWVEVNTTSPLVLGDREGSIILHVVGRHCPIDVVTSTPRRRRSRRRGGRNDFTADSWQRAGPVGARSTGSISADGSTTTESLRACPRGHHGERRYDGACRGDGERLPGLRRRSRANAGRFLKEAAVDPVKLEGGVSVHRPRHLGDGTASHPGSHLRSGRPSWAV